VRSCACGTGRCHRRECLKVVAPSTGLPTSHGGAYSTIASRERRRYAGSHQRPGHTQRRESAAGGQHTGAVEAVGARDAGQAGQQVRGAAQRDQRADRPARQAVGGSVGSGLRVAFLCRGHPGRRFVRLGHHHVSAVFLMADGGSCSTGLAAWVQGPN